MQYRSEIDGLRALAVVPVILFHAGFDWFAGGFVGVDVFFVISGYLITTIIINELAEDNFTIANFYERRARRILPALFFVMLVCLPFALIILPPASLKMFGQSLIATSSFLSNILFWQQSGYFDTSSELKPLLHTWSLAVEEQYYIFFPLFLLATWKLGIRWIVIILSVLFVASLGVAQWGAINIPNAAFFLLPTRGWELLIGVFLAFYLNKFSYLKSFAVNQALSFAGFMMIGYSIVVFDETTPFPGFYALLPTVGTGLLILSAVPKTVVHKLLSLSPFVGIGLISYSAYLWHQPILAFTRGISLEETSYCYLIVSCLSSLVLGYISWRWIEKPFRNRKRITRKVIFCFSAIGIMFFCGVGYLLTIGVGDPSGDNKRRIVFQNFYNPGIYVAEKFNSIKLKDFDSSNKKKILVIGDSFSQDLTNVIYASTEVSKLDVSTFNIAVKCGVLFVDVRMIEHLQDKSCKTRASFQSPELIKLAREADEIWLASFWAEWTIPFIRESINNIKVLNDNVTIFGPKTFGEVTEKHYFLTETKQWINLFFDHRDPSLGDKINRIKVETESANAKFIDVQRALCDGNIYCSNYDGYDIFSYDGSHLTPYGAKKLGATLFGTIEH